MKVFIIIFRSKKRFYALKKYACKVIGRYHPTSFSTPSNLEQAASHLPAHIYSNDFHKSDCCWFAKSITDCTVFKNNINWNYSYTKKNDCDMLVRIIRDFSIITPQLQQMNKIFRSA